MLDNHVSEYPKENGEIGLWVFGCNFFDAEEEGGGGGRYGLSEYHTLLIRMKPRHGDQDNW